MDEGKIDYNDLSDEEKKNYLPSTYTPPQKSQATSGLSAADLQSKKIGETSLEGEVEFLYQRVGYDHGIEDLNAIDADITQVDEALKKLKEAVDSCKSELPEIDFTGIIVIEDIQKISTTMREYMGHIKTIANNEKAIAEKYNPDNPDELKLSSFQAAQLAGALAGTAYEGLDLDKLVEEYKKGENSNKVFNDWFKAYISKSGITSKAVNMDEYEKNLKATNAVASKNFVVSKLKDKLEDTKPETTTTGGNNNSGGGGGDYGGGDYGGGDSSGGGGGSQSGDQFQTQETTPVQTTTPIQTTTPVTTPQTQETTPATTQFVIPTVKPTTEESTQPQTQPQTQSTSPTPADTQFTPTEPIAPSETLQAGPVAPTEPLTPTESTAPYSIDMKQFDNLTAPTEQTAPVSPIGQNGEGVQATNSAAGEEFTIKPSALPAEDSVQPQPAVQQVPGETHSGWSYSEGEGYVGEEVPPLEETSDIIEKINDSKDSLEDIIKGGKISKIPTSSGPLSSKKVVKGSSVIPIAAGLSAAAAAGLGTKAYLDRKNEKDDDLNSNNWQNDSELSVENDTSQNNEQLLTNEDEFMYSE